MPITLNDVSQEDNWEGDFLDRRYVIWTLSFQAKTYLYGPEKTSKVITKIITQQYADILDGFDNVTGNIETAASRITIQPDPTSADADDNYTYTETKIDGN